VFVVQVHYSLSVCPLLPLLVSKAAFWFILETFSEVRFLLHASIQIKMSKHHREEVFILSRREGTHVVEKLLLVKNLQHIFGGKTFKY